MIRIRSTALTLVILLIISASIHADTGFFIGGGFVGQRMNGTGDVTYTTYESGFDLPRGAADYVVFTYDFDVTKSGVDGSAGYSWDNRLLGGFTGTVGYRLSHRFSATVSYSIFRTKEGLVEFGEQDGWDGGYDQYEVDQSRVRIMGQGYIYRSLFLTSGVEFTGLDIKIEYEHVGRGITRADHFEDNYDMSGVVVGLGWEQPVWTKAAIVAVGTYSFTSYTNSEFILNTVREEIDIDFGGFDLAMELRYYLQ